MTNNDLRLIFSTYQNLNLIVLIDDLRLGLVARGHWLAYFGRSRGYLLCPIAHGWPDRQRNNDKCYSHLCGPAEFAGRSFPAEWDRGKITTDQLSAVLTDILRERQEDADAVQRVLEPCLQEVS